MSEEKETVERAEAEREAPPEKKIELKGERPPGVIGEMHPERLLKKLRRWRTEGSLEEEERVWEQLDKMLPK
jgi:hypothetical protein